MCFLIPSNIYVFFAFSENDCVVVLIKGSIISPDSIEYSSIQDVLLDNLNDKIKDHNIEPLNVNQCEIQCILPKKNNFHVVIKTKKRLRYSWLVAENGVIYSFLKWFLENPDGDSLFSNIQLMRMGLIIDTRLTQNNTGRAGNSKYNSRKPKNKLVQQKKKPQPTIGRAL